jgi:hypothetical protein
MDDVYSLLNIDVDALTGFPLSAKSIDNLQTMKIISKNVRILQQIESTLNVENQVAPSQKTIQEIINQVLTQAPNGDKDVPWSAHELRILSYYMALLQGNDVAYMYALELLERNWKNLYVSGLIHYVMNSWNLIRKDYREAVCRLIRKKLESYEGSNKRYLCFRNYSNFFDEDGPTRMLALLQAKNENILNAPLILGFKPSAFAQSFYSDIVIRYFDKIKNIDLSFMEDVLKKNNHDRTRKMVFANLVIRAEREQSFFDQTQIAKFANRILGDVTSSSTWAPFVGSSAEDVAKLKEAKELINQWYARRIIEEFFDYVQDKERKSFWLQYVEYVKDFRIVGSELVKYNLRKNSHIEELTQKYFILTNSSVSRTAALVLCIRNKIIVEFSDLGAIYVYNRENPILNFIKYGRLYGGIDLLKIPLLPLLVDYSYGFYDCSTEEGRLPHMKDWQNRVSYWINEKLLKAKETGLVGFAGISEEDIFQEKPLQDVPPKIEPIEEPSHTITPQEPSAKKVGIEDNIDANKLNVKKEQQAIEGQNNKLPRERRNAIDFKASSSWLYYSRCRIVVSLSGYYLQMAKSNQFVLLRPLNVDEVDDGSFELRRLKDNWYKVSLVTLFNKQVIGFIQCDSTVEHIYYKEDIEQEQYKVINLD